MDFHLNSTLPFWLYQLVSVFAQMGLTLKHQKTLARLLQYTKRKLSQSHLQQDNNKKIVMYSDIQAAVKAFGSFTSTSKRSQKRLVKILPNNIKGSTS